MIQSKTRNREFPVPLEESEIEAKVNYWWSSMIDGKNQFGTGQRAHVVGWPSHLNQNFCDPEVIRRCIKNAV
jgi:hypothetical protein